MDKYTEGWITVPGKGRRWRTANGEYMMQRPAGGVIAGLTGMIGEGLGSLGRAVRGLPGAVARSPQFQAVRDTALTAAQVPLPERTFIQAMTGGVNGGITSLPPQVLSAVKVRDAQRQARHTAAKVHAQENGKPAPPMRTNLSLYGSHRDATLTLGNAQVHHKPGSPAVIIDRWDVDSPNLVGRTGVVADIAEGGPLATAAFRAAQAAGTYEPIPINVRITSQEWDAIPAPGPEDWKDSYERTYQYNEHINRNPANFSR